jgi:hypothetical protein
VRQLIMNARHRAVRLIIVAATPRSAPSFTRRQTRRAAAEYPTELAANEGDRAATCSPCSSGARSYVRTGVIITVISKHVAARNDLVR